MQNNGYQHYKEQSVNTMTPGELMMLLYDELVKRLLRCGLALDNKYPISGNLHQLYEYFCYELQRVKIGRNKEELEKVKPMIMELRDTFREADKKASEG